MFSNLNTQNFVLPEIVSEGPVGDVVDCKVSRWSSWSTCILNEGEDCGKGYRLKVRQILVHPMNGGRACPKKLIKKMKCKIECEDDYEEPDDTEETAPTWGEPESPNDVEDSDCVMSKWTAWSPCSTICGSDAVQIKTRSIIKRRPGAVCPTRIMERKCPLPLACTDKGFPFRI